MRVLFCLTSFPASSQTFVDSQITGLLDRNIDVGIVSLQPAREAVRHEATLAYDLVRRTSYVPRTSRAVLREFPKLLRPLLLGRPSLERVGALASFAARATTKESFRLLRRSLAVLDQWPFDAIVCHFGPVGRELQEVRDAGITTRPMVTFFHGYDVSRTIAERGAGYYRRLFEAGDQLLPISDYWRRKLLELGAPPERTLVHRMGVDCRKIVFRERTLAPGAPVQLLSVARLTEKKGLEYGLRALARLPEAPAFHHHLVGDGELRGALERLVDELGLRERVTFHGWKSQAEVQRLLERSHLLLQPSVTAADGDQEGIPVVLMEAMAAGLPVVSTFHTGIPELVEDDESGVLVPERDVTALSERLSDLMAHPERWAALGRHGRARVEEQFDVNVLNDQLAERLRGLVEKRSRA